MQAAWSRARSIWRFWRPTTETVELHIDRDGLIRKEKRRF